MYGSTILVIDGVSELVAFVFQYLNRFAFIALAAVGLAIIFGMMGVINLAHGEFIIIGMYGTALTYHSGVPLPLAMVAGVIVTAVFGVIIERTVIRHLYDRLLDSMVATWGLGLVISQLLLIIFGSSLSSISMPMGGISYGGYSATTYATVFLPAMVIAILIVLYVIFTRTEFGVKARATIDDPETARAMGVDTDRMYAITFGIGAGLAGAAGALAAPTLSITPDQGSVFLLEAFVAVVVGGPSVIIGTLSAAGVLGFFHALFTNMYGTFIGQMAMLIVAIIALRVLPDGITGYVEKLRERRSESS